MLFLYRPRQTWMPFARPLAGTQQAAYNRQLQDQFASTCRVPRPMPSATERNPIEDLKDLAELHGSGALTDAEFQAMKAKVLAR